MVRREIENADTNLVVHKIVQKYTGKVRVGMILRIGGSIRVVRVIARILHGRELPSRGQ